MMDGTAALRRSPHVCGPVEAANAAGRVLAPSDGHRIFDSLRDEHLEAIYNYLCRLLGNMEEASDATVETFRRAYRGMGLFRGECSARTWLLSIANNVARSHQRAAMRDGHASLDELRERGIVSESDPRADVERLVLGEIEANRLLGLLPGQQRLALWMRVGLQMTDDEVATLMNVPVGTVKSWVWRSLTKLRKACRDEGSIGIGHESDGMNDSDVEWHSGS